MGKHRAPGGTYEDGIVAAITGREQALEQITEQTTPIGVVPAWPTRDVDQAGEAGVR